MSNRYRSRVPKTRFHDMHNKAISLTLALCFAALTLGLAASCNKMVTYGRKKPIEIDPKTPPEGNAGLEDRAKTDDVTPDTKLKLTINRVNSKSWWKVCVDAWVVEFPDLRQSLGCNTDASPANKTFELDGSTQQCNTIALSFSVFKNTEPCSSDASSCPHADEPSHIRATSNSSDSGFFKAASIKDLKFPFESNNLKDIVIPSEYESEYESLSSTELAEGETRFRVFFEDQVETTYQRWKSGGNAATNGIDFFDYVIEVGSREASLQLEGHPSLKCP